MDGLSVPLLLPADPCGNSYMSLSAPVPALAMVHNRHRSSTPPGPKSPSAPSGIPQGLMEGFVPQQGRRHQEQKK